MAKLQNDKVFKSNEIQELMTVGKKTLEAARDVSKEVKDCVTDITTQLNQIPAGITEAGAKGVVNAVKSRIEKGDYSKEKTKLENSLKKLEKAVPQYDKQCANQIKKLSSVCERIYTRITDLERFLQKGKIDLSPEQFKKELDQYRKVWEQEGKELARILAAVKAGLKGLELASCQYSSDPVNLSTGNFIYDKTDLKIKGEPGLSFRRFYNALESRKGVMGTGWIHNYELLLKEENGICLYLEDGKEEHYEETEDGFESLRGSQGKLSRTETGYVYEKLDGNRYYFNEEGQYTRFEDSQENVLCLFYNEVGQLIRVQEEGGSFLSYVYDAQGQLIQVSDHTNRIIRMSYKDGELGTVEALEGTRYEYQYDGEGRLAQVVNAVGTVTVKNTYDSEGRTKRQVFPDGSKMRYRYLDEDGRVELTERNGAKIIYCHDSLYRNTRTIYEDGEENYTYNRNNQRTSYTDKNGNRTVYGYDGWGHLSKVVDALGNRMNLTYNDKGKLLNISLNGKEKLKNNYDKEGNLIQSMDGEGNTTRFQYDDKHRPICIVQADGSRIQVVYDEKGNIKKLTDATGAELQYRYDKLGRVSESQDGNGNITQYCYNEKDELVTVTNAEGNTKKYEYNHGGKVTRIVDFDGSVTELAYNNLNRVEQVTDQEGCRTRYAYDRMWNLTEILDAEGGKTEYIYNLQNLLETVTDAEGRSVHYTYDACGNQTEVQGTAGEQTLFRYDALNRLVEMEESDGVITKFAYDAEGNTTNVEDSIGNLRKMEYNEIGQCILEQDRQGREIRYAYDALGNVTSVTDGAGRKTEYVYRPGGQLEKILYPDGTWESFTYDGCGNVTRRERMDGYCIGYVYDCMNRLARMESSTGQTESYRYDAVGNVISVTDANGNETVYRYNRTGNLIETIDAEGGRTICHYDSNGLLREVQQPGENGEETRRTRYVRNPLGQVTGVEDAFGRMEYFTYDKAGRLAEKLDRDGNRTAYVYNIIGQPERITYGDGKEVKFTYDALRQLQEVKDWLGTMTFTHDVTGNLTSTTDQQGKEVKYRYGLQGEREAVIYPDGREVTYGYDELLRLSCLRSGDMEAVYCYDTMGRLTARQTSEGLVTEYGYDSTGLLSDILHKNAEEVLESSRYRYDPAGNRIAEERYRRGLEGENGTYTYEYDRMNRLIQTMKDGEILRNYRYDSFGNRKEKTEAGLHTHYTYNALNQLIRDTDGVKEHSYEYDSRGNLLRSLENGKLQHTYEFGAMNRMTRVVDGMGNVAEYRYNGLGHRIGMRRGKVEQNIWNKETAYILDLTKNYHNLLQKEETDCTQSYIWDSEAVFLEENGAISSYVNDIQGSTMRLLNHGGEGMVTYGYDEFGTDLYQNQGKYQPFGYTGYQRDEVSGTYYAQAREYNAETGRFTSKDVIKGSVAYPETLNVYGYCWGNPVKFVDRDGAFPKFSDIKNKVDDTIDTIKKAAGKTIKWSQKIWEQDIVGTDQVYVSEDINGAKYEVSTHKGGKIIVIKKDESGKPIGWSVNAKVTFGDASINAKLSGKGANPRTWKYSESIKKTDKETGVSNTTGRYMDANGYGLSIATGGTSGNMPFPLPDGTQIDDFESINWSLSYDQEFINWKILLETVLTAGAIAAYLFLLAYLIGNDLSGVGVADDPGILLVLAQLREYFNQFGEYFKQLFSQLQKCIQ